MGEEITLDLRDFLFILRKRLKLILSITIISTLVAAIVSFFFLTPVYESKSSIVIGAVKTSNQSAANYEYSDVMMYQKLVKTFAKIATSEDTALDAIIQGRIKVEGDEGLEDMNPKDFIKMLSVSPQADTQIIDFKVQNKDKELAKSMVEAIGKSFMKKVEKTFPEVNIDIIDTAKIPEKPVKPNKKMNVIIAMFLGLMSSVGLCFLLEFLDGTVKTQEELEKIMGLPVIGGIPRHDLDL